MNKELKKQQYFAKKEELNVIRDEITLKRWKVLSKAYKLGKQIWGSRFTRVRLAHDMELPFTTVVRCLSLDRCSKRTWRLIKEGKISVFKVAQICMSKNITFQDEIVDMVIKDNLSTYQITSLKVKSVGDLNKERHRIACEKGFSRKTSAYRSIQIWIARGQLLMRMNQEHLPEEKLPQIKKDIKNLKEMMEKYLQ